MKKSIFNRNSWVCLVLSLSIAFTSCKKDDDPAVEVPVAGSNNQVNNWVYDIMSDYYLWNATLPANPNFEQQPSDFFEDLRNAEDRFSVIVPDYDALINSLGGVTKEAGYEFGLYRELGSSQNVLALVQYVKKGSPAESSGLKRGDEIFKINGQQLNLSNYISLITSTSENHEVTYRRFDTDAEAYVAQAPLQLNTLEFSENPHFLDSIYIADNGDKVGYYVYNFFARGASNEGSQYDDQMDAIFANFKAEGIKHLILDLRYNGGGLVSSAVNMASQIGNGVSKSSIFYRNEFNPALQAALLAQEGEGFFNTYFTDKVNNIGANLAGGKLIVLTTRGTASASELVINGLRPYMGVFIIGEKSRGKNVGSVPFDDEDNPENKWGLLPIIFKSYNSQGNSDYSDGFVPDLTLSETSNVMLLPLGDVNEVYLKASLLEIAGDGARRGEPGKAGSIYAKSLGGSLDFNPRQGVMIDDQFKDILIK